MPAADPYSAAIQAGIGGITSAIGLINAGKAKREAERLAKSRPTYSINPYAKDDVALAESELANGMSGAASNAYEQGNDRSLSTSLDAILKGGGSVNNVSDVFDASAEGRSRLAMLRENMRLGQINNAVQAHQYYNDQLDKQFMYNVDAPWKDAAAANAAARTAAQQQIWGGLNTAASAGMQFAATNNDASTRNDTFNLPPQ